MFKKTKNLKLELFKMYLLLVGSNRHEHHLLSEHAVSLQTRKGIRKVDVARTYHDALRFLAKYAPKEGGLVLVADSYAFANQVGGRLDTAALMVHARTLGGKVVFHGSHIDIPGAVHQRLAHHSIEKSSKNLGCPDAYHEQVLAPVLSTAG